MAPIRIDEHGFDSLLGEHELFGALEDGRSALNRLREGTGPGSEWLGWRRILAEPDAAEIERIRALAARIRGEADTVVFAGIGGSYLGTRAVMEALLPRYDRPGPDVLFAGHHMGARETEDLLDHLRRPVDGRRRSIFVVVISKSGTTLETALAFRAVRSLLDEWHGEHAADRIVAITGPEGGVLNRLAEAGYHRFVIPDDVGGRFSVLTPVGLLPLAICGVDVDALLQGARDAFHLYEQDPEQVLRFASLRHLAQTHGKALEVVASFEPELDSFTAWIQQLQGESEGKEGFGLFPVRAAFSTDLHSIGQIIQQGRRNLIETLLVVDAPTSQTRVTTAPQRELDAGRDDGLGYLEGRTVFSINRTACTGTIQAHVDGGVPVITVHLARLDATSLGALIYFYELATAVSGYLLGINPFDQPGVEDYKREMYRLLRN